jgi:hypothetical protein
MTDSQASTILNAAARPASSQLFPWYDSVWLTRYTRAREIVRRLHPEKLPMFEGVFSVLRTASDFRIKRLDKIFNDETLSEIRRVVSSLRPTDLELHEARMFGRFVVHDHPLFNELQQRTLALVADAAGEPVEASYNFLSLYSDLGRCPLHMDAPEAKWTLDLCISQSTPWPIYFSDVQSWPESDGQPWAEENWEERIKHSPSMRFTPCTLQPGEAVLFSGSSQWHYRDSIPREPRETARQFCDLLFFHYIPRGTAELVRPKNWANLFHIPELAEIA